jgi:hypothetical protein
MYKDGARLNGLRYARCTRKATGFRLQASGFLEGSALRRLPATQIFGAPWVDHVETHSRATGNLPDA